jgi:hypothetical protein
MIVDYDRVDGLYKKRVSGELNAQEVNIDPFFKVVDKEERIAEPVNRVQVREYLVDPNKVNKIAQLIIRNGDRNIDPMDIVVNYPNDAGQAIIGGNHTCGGLFEVGRDSGKAFVYDFFEDFDGNKENVKRYANLVNCPSDGKFSDFITEHEVKRELYDLMDARQKAGLEAVPSEEEKRKLLQPYPFVNLATLGQWIGHHPTYGGRVAPRIMYDPAKLASIRVSYEHMEAYKGWNILSPRTLNAANEEALAAAIKKITETGIKKVLIPIYASTKAHADRLAKGEVQASIQKMYDEIGEVLGITLKAEFLKYE